MYLDDGRELRVKLPKGIYADADCYLQSIVVQCQSDGPHLLYSANCKRRDGWLKLRPPTGYAGIVTPRFSPNGKRIVAMVAHHAGGDFFGGKNYYAWSPFEYDISKARWRQLDSRTFDSVGRPSYTKDGDIVFSADGDIAKWSRKSGKVTTIYSGKPAFDGQIGNDDNILFISGVRQGDEGTLIDSIVYLKENLQTSTLHSVGSSVKEMVVPPSGNRIFFTVEGKNDRVSLLDARSGVVKEISVEK
jgi:hypothetical protein